ncbi:HNH endonuclease [Bacillus subtilis]
MVQKIPLSNGGYALVDDSDFEELSKYKWSKTRKDHRRTEYARTNIKIAGMYKTRSMHRLILGLSTADRIIVDHINGNGLDNRRVNLRLANYSDNAANVKLNKNNTSGYKGVNYRRERSLWRTEIRKGRKTVYKECSKCKHVAGLKYNVNALKIHGPFAWLNEVRDCGCAECVEYKRENGLCGFRGRVVGFRMGESDVV